MAQITVNSLAVSFGETLFKNVNISLGDGDRVGVVGNNGAGKTTLLRCVANEIVPTEGRIVRSKGLRIAFVEQSPSRDILDLTLRELVASALPIDERDSLGWRAEVLLEDFGAPEDMRDRPLHKLSGGWQRLGMIGRAWVSSPDVLIIDEPTNHLDLAKILQLEQWLNDQIGRTPILMVSHDRHFLDKCTNRTLFLRTGESKSYSYSFSEARVLLNHDDQALENKKEHEQVEMNRLRKSAHHLRQIGVNNFSVAALRKSIQIANRADAIEESLPETHAEQTRDVRLASRGTHAKRIIGFKDFTVRRPDGVALFKIGQLNIIRGDRIALLGRNGTGKTQLVRKLLAGFQNPELVRSEGIEIASSVVMGYIDQLMSQLPEYETAATYLINNFVIDRQRTVSTLVSAGFSRAHQTLKISELSPGQRARLALLALRLETPSFFLMDEPTNHLDIAGQEQLESEILSHDASALLVSHDRAFVENTGTRFLIIENNGLIEVESPDIFYSSLMEGVNVASLLARPHWL